MPDRPDILIFLMDAAQAAALEASSPCLTPNFDRLRDRGLTFTRAYSPSPTCSPSRASLMTGLLPHNHGVLEVEHGRDPDQCVLRTDKPHFAQRLREQGYRTGYFGKWHIERSNELEAFGWSTSVVKGAENYRGIGKGQATENPQIDPGLSGYLDGPVGYRRILHWGVTDIPPEERYPHATVDHVIDFLEKSEGPRCACASFSEPNETLIVSRSTYERYDSAAMTLPGTLRDDLSGRPGLYRRERAIAQHLSDDHWRQARSCYFGRITELDSQFGRMMDQLEQSGRMENTIVFVTSDHGRYAGAHGFDAHNIGAFEEIYRVPLVIAGPGITTGTCNSTVNFHDLCPTICELAGALPIDVPDSKSLLPQLRDPTTGAGPAYAENHGSRYRLTQRILWDGCWKFVFNGFDFDELYDLENDPAETVNLIDEPAQQDRADAMMREIWNRIHTTGDRTLEESHYFSLRLGRVGPEPDL
jgi:arylsulfatase A-like enzyme